MSVLWDSLQKCLMFYIQLTHSWCPSVVHLLSICRPEDGPGSIMVDVFTVRLIDTNITSVYKNVCPKVCGHLKRHASSGADTFLFIKTKTWSLTAADRCLHHFICNCSCIVSVFMSVNILVSCVRFLLSSVFPPDVEPADAERSGLTLRLHEAALSSVRDRHEPRWSYSSNTSIWWNRFQFERHDDLM